MTSPYQTDSLQGHCRVNGGVLAAKDAGTGSGWQQSKPNCALSAVKGELVRMASGGPLAGAKLVPLHLLVGMLCVGGARLLQ